MLKSRNSVCRLTSFAIVLSITVHATLAAGEQEVQSEQRLIETLRSASPAEKAMACKQLAIHGSKAAVPELAKLLADEQLASWSRIALEAIPDPTADVALLEAAKTLQGRLLVGTINSIGVRRSAGAVDHLAVRLKDTNEDVASAAAVALGRIGTDKAIHAGRQSFADASPAVRSAIAEGGILCAERLLAEGKNDAAAAIYDEVRRADVPQQRILEATRGAILARGEQGIPLLVEQLKSPDKAMFQIALSTARELAGRKVGDALAGALAGAPSERASLIVFAIGDRDDGMLPPAVMQAARTGDAQVRLAAIEVVGKLGGASSVAALLEIASGPDAELSQAAKEALAHLPGDEVNTEILRRVPQAESEFLPILFDAIGRRRIHALDHIVNAINHTDKAVRRAALTALGATAAPQDLAILISKVIDPKYPADAEVAWQALEAASIRMPDRESTATVLASQMPLVEAEAEVRLLRILGAMGGAKALQTVAAAAKSDDARLQDAGTRVLGEWMTADAAPVLLTIAKDSSSQNKYQVRALRGYLRIARQLDLPDNQRIDMCRQAIAIAERPEERGLALDALKRCPSAEAVELASSLLNDKEIRDRAVETAIFIGEKIKDKDPAAAKSAGEKALEASPPKELADRARALTSP